MTFTNTQSCSTNGRVLSQYPEGASGPVGVVGSRLVQLLNGLQANDVGFWIPNDPYVVGNLEVESVGSMVGTVQLYGSNEENQPGNGWVLTVTGSVTAGDVLNVLIATDTGLPQITASYTVPSTGSPSTSTIAAGLALAIANALKAINYLNNTQEEAIAASFITVSNATNAITIYTQQPFAHLSVSVSALSAVTEVVTPTQYDSGLGQPIGTALTAPGTTSYNGPFRFIKANLTGYSSGAITARLDEAYGG